MRANISRTKKKGSGVGSGNRSLRTRDRDPFHSNRSKQARMRRFLPDPVRLDSAGWFSDHERFRLPTQLHKPLKSFKSPPGRAGPTQDGKNLFHRM